MNVFETERLILRTWQEADTTPFIAINQDPDVMRYFPYLQDRAYTLSLIEKIEQHQQKYGFSLYAVELKKTGEMIGFTGLFNASFKAHFTPAMEIGWRIASQHWNKGYATEAAKTVLHAAFHQFNLDEVVSFTTETNIPSRSVMEKIGLQYNPRDDFNHPALKSDSPLLRHVLYRLSKKDYRANNHKVNLYVKNQLHSQINHKAKDTLKLGVENSKTGQLHVFKGCSHLTPIEAEDEYIATTKKFLDQ